MGLLGWIVASFRQHPELAIFATLALGYWIGSKKIGSFSLGHVTGVLLAGVLVGQMQITISPQVKAVFFIMFLFAVGYGVGPQFFRGLKKDGAPQALFTVLQCLVSLGVVYAIARYLGYDAGTAAGLLAGSQTMSSVLGSATSTIDQLGVAPAEKAALANRVPVAYAVTYMFGTAGAAWVLASLGPKLLRVDLAAECKSLEASLGAPDADPAVISAARRVDVRCFQVTNAPWVNASVAALEERMRDTRTSIERVRRGDAIIDAEPALLLTPGDVIAVVGHRDVLVASDLGIGPEVHDFDLLDFAAETLDVVVTNREVAGQTIAEIAASEVGRERARGVYLTGLVRGGEEMPFRPGTKVERGDVVRVVGAKRHVERVANDLGYADRPTNATDMVFVGAGIALGGLLGTLSVTVGGTPVGLGTSVGALITGLVFGWLRSVHRTFGRVPAPALWILNNVGLTTFIAVVGISAGPSFVAGVRETGVSLLLAGVVATTTPLLAGLLMGTYLFKFHPAITFGATAGAQTTTAALPMLVAVARSHAPALGYSVPFAVAAIVLTLWGMVIVHLIQ